MKRSKEFILKGSYSSVYLHYLNGVEAKSFCRETFERVFGIKIKAGESKRVKVTIQEIK